MVLKSSGFKKQDHYSTIDRKNWIGMICREFIARVPFLPQ
jgi:hypothetical protein